VRRKSSTGRRGGARKSADLFSLVISLSIVACSPTAPDDPAWGSDQASLTITQNQMTLQIVASGGCYGSFGEIERSDAGRLSGTFVFAGTYTELTGAAPGSRQYPAEYSGTVSGNHMTLSVSVPALPRIVGPFTLTAGLQKTWPPCRYP
jgi:hypothetical protein